MVWPKRSNPPRSALWPCCSKKFAIRGVNSPLCASKQCWAALWRPGITESDDRGACFESNARLDEFSGATLGNALLCEGKAETLASLEASGAATARSTGTFFSSGGVGRVTSSKMAPGTFFARALENDFGCSRSGVTDNTKVFDRTLARSFLAVRGSVRLPLAAAAAMIAASSRPERYTPLMSTKAPTRLRRVAWLCLRQKLSASAAPVL